MVATQAVGAESAYDCGSIPCDEFVADASDQASLQHGAALYANYCAGCHSLQYSRHNRVAKDLGIPKICTVSTCARSRSEDRIADGHQHGQRCRKGWFGAAPPDLTLISRAKKPEYLYTYLYFLPRRFSPLWRNNLVYPNVGMPHVLLELQGLPQCVNADSDHAEGHCDSLEVSAAGVMTTAEFDGAMYDLVNFLAYTAEPSSKHASRSAKGDAVLGHLLHYRLGIEPRILERRALKACKGIITKGGAVLRLYYIQIPPGVLHEGNR